MTMDPRWVAELLAEPRLAAWRERPADRRGAVRFRKKRLPLVLKSTTGGYWEGWVCLWYVEDDQGIVAAGLARVVRARGRVLELGSSAVAPAARGQGLYTAVLRELARVFGGPIESDHAIAPAAAAAWLRAGGLPADRAGKPIYRLEPASG